MRNRLTVCGWSLVGEQSVITQSDAMSIELTEPGFGDEINTSTKLIRRGI